MSRKTRRIYNRSGTRPCEICERVTILEQHHIRGRNVPNANRAHNLANICADCHTKVHHGVLVIEDRIMTSDGLELIWHHYKESSLTGRDAKPWLI